MRINEEIFDKRKPETAARRPETAAGLPPRELTPDDCQFSMTLFMEMIPVRRTSQSTGFYMTRLIRRIKHILAVTDICVHTEPYLSLCMKCSEPSWKPTYNYAGYDYVNNPTAVSSDKAPGIVMFFNLTTGDTRQIGMSLFSISQQAGAVFKTSGGKSARLEIYKMNTAGDDREMLFSITPEDNRRRCAECAAQCVTVSPDYEPLRLTECLHDISGMPAMIREDILDGRAMGIRDDMPDTASPDTVNTFDFALTFSTTVYSDDNYKKPAVTPESLTKDMKTYVHYMKNCGMFSGMEIKKLTVDLESSDNGTWTELAGTPIKTFIRDIPKTVFGYDVETASGTGLLGSPKIKAKVSVHFRGTPEFRNPISIYRFFSFMYSMNRDEKSAALTIWPHGGNKHERAEKIQDRFVNGSFWIPIGSNISGHAFPVFYYMLMDRKSLRAFSDYIVKREKTDGFPMRTINDLLKEDETE